MNGNFPPSSWRNVYDMQKKAYACLVFLDQEIISREIERIYESDEYEPPSALIEHISKVIDTWTSFAVFHMYTIDGVYVGASDLSLLTHIFLRVCQMNFICNAPVYEEEIAPYKVEDIGWWNRESISRNWKQSDVYAGFSTLARHLDVFEEENLPGKKLLDFWYIVKARAAIHLVQELPQQFNDMKELSVNGKRPSSKWLARLSSWWVEIESRIGRAFGIEDLLLDGECDETVVKNIFSLYFSEKSSSELERNYRTSIEFSGACDCPGDMRISQWETPTKTPASDDMYTNFRSWDKEKFLNAERRVTVDQMTLYLEDRSRFKNLRCLYEMIFDIWDEIIYIDYKFRWKHACLIAHEDVPLNIHKIKSPKVFPLCVKFYSRYAVVSNDGSIYACSDPIILLARWLSCIKDDYDGKMGEIPLTPLYKNGDRRSFFRSTRNTSEGW